MFWIGFFYVQFDRRMSFVVYYFQGGELDGGDCFSGVGNNDMCQTLSQFCPQVCRLFLAAVDQMFNGFSLNAVVTAWVVSSSRFIGFVFSPDCAVQNSKGGFFRFGWQAAHLYYVVGIVECVHCWVEDSILSSGMAGWGCREACVFSCPVHFAVVTAQIVFSSQK